MTAKSPITTHVLDTALGRPATGIRACLERQNAAGDFAQLGEGVTNDDGRITNLIAPGSLEAGVFRLTFYVEEYLRRTAGTGFYPHVPIVFEVRATDEHYHVPLLLNPYGYSTYRGS